MRKSVHLVGYFHIYLCQLATHIVAFSST